MGTGPAGAGPPKPRLAIQKSRNPKEKHMFSRNDRAVRRVGAAGSSHFCSSHPQTPLKVVGLEVPFQPSGLRAGPSASTFSVVPKPQPPKVRRAPRLILSDAPSCSGGIGLRSSPGPLLFRGPGLLYSQNSWSCPNREPARENAWTGLPRQGPVGTLPEAREVFGPPHP